MPLTVPNTAPFSGPQKMWLKGFLDGLNRALVPPQAVPESLPAPAGVDVTILWGSQTGNAEALGKKLAKSLAARGNRPVLRDMAEVAPADLAAAGNIVVITSTYGDGEPPDNAASLHAALHAPDAPQLANVNFAVLALGDSNYADFCKCGRDFHNRFAALGADPIAPLVECDVDFDSPFKLWTAQLGEALCKLVPA